MKLKKKTTIKYDRPMRRQSFSDFSQSYSGGLNRNKRSYSEKLRRRKTLMRVLVVFGIVALFILGYIIISVMLNLSQLPPETAAAFIAC